MPKKDKIANLLSDLYDILDEADDLKNQLPETNGVNGEAFLQSLSAGISQARNACASLKTIHSKGKVDWDER